MRVPVGMTELLEPAIESLGYELLGIEYHSQGKHSILRLFIDSPNGINADDCGSVSHQVSGILDVEELLKGSYNLEVSSPGTDRPLFKLKHYEQLIGRNIKVKLREAVGEQKKFKGEITHIDGQKIFIFCEDIKSEVGFEVTEVDKANLIPE
ncbi:Bacterial ribosome SSU maturation protein RimP [hydrothermal vent metagenome]|uniref:Bacterial ribosome SSU maturation protein RimP n=1 Tax=hydrothermal vent metagenome TaxID=652676 RepID=A0A3B0ZUL1_9ZZZZ